MELQLITPCRPLCVFKALKTIKHGLFGKKPLLLLLCCYVGTHPEISPQTNFSCWSLCGETSKCGRQEEEEVYFFKFNTPAERSIKGQLIRGDPRDYIKAQKRKKLQAEQRQLGRELVAMGNPRADNFTLKHEKVFHGGDVLLSVVLLNAWRPPALITLQRCQKQHDTAFRAGPHTTFKQRLPLISYRITWHHCPSRKRRFKSN